MPERIQQEFDFSTLADHPVSVKIDVGASSFYSEMASLQTLDNLLLNHMITPVQYLERIPDGNIAGRRKLIEELKEQERQARQQAAMEQAAQMMQQQVPTETGNIAENEQTAEQRTTGFKELGEALRSVNRRAG